MITDQELNVCKNIMQHWYWRIYGFPHFKKLVSEFSRDKKKRKSKNDTDYRPRALKDFEIEMVNLNHDLDVQFKKKPFIVRPNVENVDRFFFSDMMSKDDYAQIQSDLYGIPLKPVDRDTYYEGMMMQNMQAIPMSMAEEQAELQKDIAEIQKPDPVPGAPNASGNKKSSGSSSTSAKRSNARENSRSKMDRKKEPERKKRLKKKAMEKYLLNPSKSNTKKQESNIKHRPQKIGGSD